MYMYVRFCTKVITPIQSTLGITIFNKLVLKTFFFNTKFDIIIQDEN